MAKKKKWQRKITQNNQSIIVESFSVPKTNKFIFILGIMGLCLSSYLWYLHEADIIIPCTTGGCMHILTGEYSTLLGIPVATWGAIFYLFVIYTSFLRFKIKSLILDAHLSLAILTGFGFTIYLRVLEFTKIGDICSWCWISAIFSLTLLVLILMEQKKQLLKLVKHIV